MKELCVCVKEMRVTKLCDVVCVCARDEVLCERVVNRA